jgi:hypothetical protein
MAVKFEKVFRKPSRQRQFFSRDGHLCFRMIQVTRPFSVFEQHLESKQVC